MVKEGEHTETHTKCDLARAGGGPASAKPISFSPLFFHKKLQKLLKKNREQRRRAQDKHRAQEQGNESREKEVVLPDVRYNIFLALLEHLYTDTVEIPLEIAHVRALSCAKHAHAHASLRAC